MRTLSTFGILILFIPIAVALFSIFDNYYLYSRDAFVTKSVLLGNISSIVFYVIFIVVAFFLNAREKHLENIVMCGTLFSGYVISTVLTYVIMLLEWLK